MLLILTSTIAKVKTSRIRLLIGAFIASLIVLISIFYSDKFLSSIPGKFLYSLIIIVSIFRFLTINRTFKLLLLFYFITFTVGGGLFAIPYMLQQPIGISSSGFITVNRG